MKSISLTTLGDLLIASGMAMLCSLILAVVMGAFVPFVIEDTDAGARAPTPGKVYTEEQLNRAEKEAKARMKARAEDKSFESRAKTLRSMQRPALWISWVPWLLLPFFVRVSSILYGAMVLIVPGLMVATTVAPPESLLVFAIALALGVWAKHAYKHARQAT